MSAVIDYYKRHRVMAFLVLVAIPASLLTGTFNMTQVLVFSTALLAYLPLSNAIGIGTEVLSAKIGTHWGALVNITLGNLPELIVALLALSAGLVKLVLGAIAGSFAGNALFVLGLSMYLGGRKHGEQSFSLERANTKTLYLTLMGMILMMLPVLELFSPEVIRETTQLVEVSIGLAIILFIAYCAYMVSTINHKEPEENQDDEEIENWSTTTALVVLLVAGVLVYFVSDFLVGSVEAVTQTLPISEAFIGFIIIPTASNAAEHLVAATMAAKNKMALAVEISVGSALQIAGFMMPVVVLAGLIMNTPVELVFAGPQLLAVMAAVWFSNKVLADGKTNWQEGIGAIALFAAVAMVFYFLF